MTFSAKKLRYVNRYLKQKVDEQLGGDRRASTSFGIGFQTLLTFFAALIRSPIGCIGAARLMMDGTAYPIQILVLMSTIRNGSIVNKLCISMMSVLQSDLQCAQRYSISNDLDRPLADIQTTQKFIYEFLRTTYDQR